MSSSSALTGSAGKRKVSDMVKVPYQTPSLVDIGNFGELTTGFGGDASDGVFTFFKRTSDFAR